MRVPTLFAATLLASFCGVMGGLATASGTDLIQGELALSNTVLEWLTLLYFLAINTIIPIASACANRWGMQHTLSLAILIMWVGALIAACAPDFAILALGRTLQGIGAGLLFPLGMAFAALLFPPERLSFALVLYLLCAFALSLGLGIGVVGWLSQHIGWRSVFALIVALSILSNALFLLYPPHPEKPARIPFDIIGYIPFALSVAMLLIALVNGNLSATDAGWRSPWIVALLALTVPATITSLVMQVRHPHPLFPTELFRNAEFVICSIGLFLIGTSLFSTITLSLQFALSFLHYQRDIASYIIAPFGFVILAGSLLATYLSKKIPLIFLILSGYVALICGDLYASTFTLRCMPSDLALFVALRAFGIGLAFTPLTVRAMQSLPRHLLGQASTFLTYARQLGATCSLALTGILQIRRTIFHTARFSEQAADPSTGFHLAVDALAAKIGSIGGLGNAHDRAHRLLIDNISLQAQVAAWCDSIHFFFYPTLALLILLAFLSFRKRHDIVKP